MKVFRVAAVVVLLASPAFAQQTPSLNLLMDNKPAKSQEEKDAEAARDTSHKKDHTQNTDEQGETANIKQNTMNAGFFKGRRVK